MSVINMNPEALEKINEMLEKDNIDDKVDLLRDVESKLQQIAFEDLEHDAALNLFEVAYMIKLLAIDFLEIKKALYHENEC